LRIWGGIASHVRKWPWTSNVTLASPRDRNDISE
jgi:hypothetical protein